MNSRLKVLVVEDEPEISDVVSAYLRKDGYEPRVVKRGSEVMTAARQMRCDLVLLDVNLPDIDGFALCRALRAEGAMPIIMLTARNDELDRIRGLDLGADDYISKPFSPSELMARIRAVMRRAHPALMAPRSGSGISLDDRHQSASLRGARLDLTLAEFLILQALLKGEGRVRTRAQLSESMGGAERASDRVIDTHIKNIRKKIAAVAPDADIIKSSYGVGYRIDN